MHLSSRHPLQRLHFQRQFHFSWNRWHWFWESADRQEWRWQRSVSAWYLAYSRRDPKCWKQICNPSNVPRRIREDWTRLIKLAGIASAFGKDFLMGFELDLHQASTFLWGDDQRFTENSINQECTCFAQHGGLDYNWSYFTSRFYEKLFDMIMIWLW